MKNLQFSDSYTPRSRSRTFLGTRGRRFFVFPPPTFKLTAVTGATAATTSTTTSSHVGLTVFSILSSLGQRGWGRVDVGFILDIWPNSQLLSDSHTQRARSRSFYARNTQIVCHIHCRLCWLRFPMLVRQDSAAPVFLLTTQQSKQNQTWLRPQQTKTDSRGHRHESTRPFTRLHGFPEYISSKRWVQKHKRRQLLDSLQCALSRVIGSTPCCS